MANLTDSETDRALQHAHNVASLARLLEMGALILTIGGVISGIFEFVQGGDAEIGAGIGITVAAFTVGFTLWVFARALRLYGEYVATRVKHR